MLFFHGFSDYAHVAPPHSYIHVDEFPDVKKLAERLEFLAQDENEYNVRALQSTLAGLILNLTYPNVLFERMCIHFLQLWPQVNKHK